MKRVVSVMKCWCLAALLLVLMASLALGGNEADAAAKPKLNKKSQTLVTGETYKLKVKNAAKKSKFTWKSSKKKVATVTKTGKVKAKKTGSAKITCTIKKTGTKAKKLTCKVKVVKEPSISTKTLTLGKPNTAKLAVANEVKGSKYAWTSSNAKVATVSNGTVTAVAAGKANISCQITLPSGNKKKFTVAVSVFDPSSINLGYTNLVFMGTGAVALKSTDGYTYTLLSVTSSDTSIISYKGGKLVAEGVGTAVVSLKVKCPNSTEYTKKITMTVTRPASQSIAAADPAGKTNGAMSNKTAMEFSKTMEIGWNLGNSLDYASETTAGNPKITEELFAALKDKGFDTVRIPVTWTAHTTAAKYNYVIQASWMDRVQEVVDYALKYDLKVIINIHHDGNGSSWLTPAAADTEKEADVTYRFTRLWEQISERFKNYGENLIFEGMNEFHLGYGGAAKKSLRYTNTLNQRFVDTVRKSGGNNAYRYLMVPGYNTDLKYTVPSSMSGSGAKVEFELPQDTIQNRLFVSIHYYRPSDYTLDDATYTQWGKTSEPGKSSTDGIPHTTADWAASYWAMNGTQREEFDKNYRENYPEDADYQERIVREDFAMVKQAFTDKGIPVIIGEYGCANHFKLTEKKNADGSTQMVYDQNFRFTTDLESLTEQDYKDAGEEYRVYYMEYVTKAIKDAGCLPILWDNGMFIPGQLAFFGRGGVEDGMNEETGELSSWNSRRYWLGETPFPDVLDAVFKAVKENYDISEIKAPGEE